MDFITRIDFKILDFIHENIVFPFSDQFFLFFTNLGDAGLIWFIIGAVLLCTKKYRRGGIIMLCALTIGFLTGNLIFKNIFARPRPCWLNPSVQLLIENPTDYSFPSGHTLSSVICCTVLIFANRKFAFFAVPLAVLISFSRLYLYVHFPTDILFSIIYGIAVAVITWQITKKCFVKAGT